MTDITLDVETQEITLDILSPELTLNVQSPSVTLETGARGPQGPQGPAGSGVIAGGTTGQILQKASATDGDIEWADRDAVYPEDFGAVGDNNQTPGNGTDDTAAILLALAECYTSKRPLKLRAYYRYNPPAVIDLDGENWGFGIIGAARNGCGFVVDAGKSFAVEGANSFYHRFENFQIIGNVDGPLVRIGKDDFSDAFNDFNFDRMVINNLSTGSSVEGLRLNYVLASRIHATVNCGGTGRASASSGAGKAVVLRQCAFNNFVLHCGQANIGLSIQDGASFANTFYGIDIEEVGKAVSITSASASGNKFLAGQFLGYVTFDCTEGENNWFSNAANRVNYGGGLGSELTGLVFESFASGLVTYQTGGSAAGIRLTNNTTSFDQSLAGGTAFFTNYGGGIAFTGASGDLTLTANAGEVIFGSPATFKSYTLATLPSASGAGAGATVYVTDAAGGAVPVYSDGTDWQRVKDRYVHEQALPSDTWTITHNLGFRPDVSVTDSAGSEVEGGVNHPTVNQTVLTFSGAFSGTARLK
jgi:hypothetical protein